MTKKKGKKSQAKPKKGAARTARDAWKHFREIGGLDVKSRDRELETQLRIRLNPSAPTLDDALAACTTDQLVTAFFALAEPFADMFRDIVAFFKRAGAKEGPDQWVIKIEDAHLDLAAFQSFLEAWEKVEGKFDVPAIDHAGLGIPRNVADSMPWWPRDFGWLEAPTGNVEIDTWRARYREGYFDPYPKVLTPAKVPPALKEAAAVTWATASILCSAWSRHDDVRRDMASVWNGDEDGAYLRPIETDGFALGTIGQDESDFQLGVAVAVLAHLLTQPAIHLAEIGEALEKEYARFGRRKLNLQVEQKALERVLSLPVWRQRYELYAVWIAVEAVNSLPDHKIDLHHDEGKITFSFKETTIATIKTTRPEKRLIAERRTPLSQPSGHGRVAGVQPDYGVWFGPEDAASCALVIEVKHYLKPANSRFKEVLNDYARAHPKAHIVLVNHGPAKDMTDGVAPEVKDRCHVIGDLTTRNRYAREELRDLVRASVGEPVAVAPAAGTAVIVVDISGSMRDFLKADILSTFINGLAANDVDTVYLVDDAVRDQMTISGALARLPFSAGAGTALVDPIQSLHAIYRVELLTDTDGFDQIVKAAIPISQKIEVEPGLWHLTVPCGTL